MTYSRMICFTTVTHLIEPTVALPSAQKILLVIILSDLPNLWGEVRLVWGLFSEKLSRKLLFFAPFFSLVLHISYRTRIQHLIATYSYVSFGARPCSNVSPAPCPIFVSLKQKYICHFTSEENDRNSSPLSGCSSSKLRAFLLDNFLLSTQQVDCRIHFIILIR